MHENIPDAAWGFIEWSVTGLCAAGAAMAGWTWRLAWLLSSAQKDVSAMKENVDDIRREAIRRGERTDAEIERLRENDGKLAQAIAEIPDKLMVRIDPKFSDLQNRMYGLLENRRNGNG